MKSVFHIKPQSRKAFTLLELMTVVAIASLLLTLAVPALSSISKSGQMNRSLAEMAGLLDQARQYAIAQNTYVWVAMRANPSGEFGDEVNVAVFASKTGVDPAPWSDYGTMPNDNISLINRVRTFKQLRFEDAATFTSDKIPSLPAQPAVTVANSPSQNTANFKVRIPGSSSNVDFNRVIQFTPGGEARIASSVIDVVEFGLHPTSGGKADNNNVAVLRINGLTGQTTVYRP